jgi:hypothetical protein
LRASKVAVVVLMWVCVLVKDCMADSVGDDVEETVGAVKAAIQQCCAQLRVSGAD